MRARLTTTIAFALVGVALFGDVGTADAKRRLLREEVTRLRADIAQLSNQLGFMQRDFDAQPPMGGGAAGGLCDDPCAVDSDDDGVGDCNDLCPCDPNNADTDADGMPDCADPCPDDATNACMDPCRNDSDGDGTNDCEDQCPWDPATPADSDSDGLVDCQDPCPDDATNTCWEPCKLDQDGDGVADCEDSCPWAPDAGEGSPLPGCYPPPGVAR
jgi:hypothetical protein